MAGWAFLLGSAQTADSFVLKPVPQICPRVRHCLLEAADLLWDSSSERGSGPTCFCSFSGTELKDLQIALLLTQTSGRHRPDSESRHGERTTPKDRKVTEEKPELVKIYLVLKGQGRVQLWVSFALQTEVRQLQPWTEHQPLPQARRVTMGRVTYLQVTSARSAGTCERRDTWVNTPGSYSRPDLPGIKSVH